VVGLLEIFMSNIYALPEEELEKIRARDKVCVYIVVIYEKVDK